jgi:hypothetical protein
MSVLDRVREKFQTPMSGTSKTSKSPSAAFAGTQDRDLKSFEAPSTAFPVSKVSVEDRVAAERDARIVRATLMVKEASTCRCAFVSGDVTEAGVPVTVVIRTACGLVTGDFLIPADRWQPFLFLQFIHDQDSRTAA